MFLCADSIRNYIESVDMVDNVSDEQLGFIEGSALDITVGEIYQIPHTPAYIGRNRTLPELEKVNPDEFGLYVLHSSIGRMSGLQTPEEENFVMVYMYLLQSYESFKLPGYIGGIVYPRTSFFNAGCNVLCSRISPGFNGRLRAGLVIYNQGGLMLERGARFASVMFHQFTDGKTDAYKGIWQGDKVTTNGVERGF